MMHHAVAVLSAALQRQADSPFFFPPKRTHRTPRTKPATLITLVSDLLIRVDACARDLSTSAYRRVWRKRMIPSRCCADSVSACELVMLPSAVAICVGDKATPLD